MIRKHHPKDRLERRSIEAKALELKQFRQQRINGKKRLLKTQIEEEEADNELRRVSRSLDFLGQHA